MRRALCLLAVFFIASVLVEAQENQVGSTASAGLSSIPPPPSASAKPATLRDQNVDQLIAHLTELRARKAEIEKQEKETTAVLADKLKEQRQKLQKLGVVVGPPPAPPVAVPVDSTAPVPPSPLTPPPPPGVAPSPLPANTNPPVPAN